MIKYYIKGQRKELDNEFILQFQILQIISEIMKDFTVDYKVELDFVINSCPASLYSVKVYKEMKPFIEENHSNISIYLTTVPNSLDIGIFQNYTLLHKSVKIADRQILLNYSDPKFLDILRYELENL